MPNFASLNHANLAESGFDWANAEYESKSNKMTFFIRMKWYSVQTSEDSISMLLVEEDGVIFVAESMIGQKF